MLLTTVATKAELDPEQEILDLLLEDPEWLEVQFAAIMTASGLRDPLFTGTLACPPPENRGARTPRALGRAKDTRRTSVSSPRSRVRSPPQR